jgi:hypothetical protein
MITSKRHNTAEEYPIATLLQHLQHALTPAQLDRIHWLLFALIARGTLAQTPVCLFLAQLTPIAPNTWRQRLKRLRQHPFPNQTLFPTLLRLVVAWLRLPEVFLALDATTLGNRWTVLVPSRGKSCGATPKARGCHCARRCSACCGARCHRLFLRMYSGVMVAPVVCGNRAQQVASADAHQRAGQLSSVVGAWGACVGVVVSCAGGSAGGACWGGVSVSVAVYFGGVLGRRGAGCVVFVDGLACACGVWVVVWVSDVD